MLKKAIPLFLLSGLVLGGCNTDNAVPKNNETPMEDVEDRERNWTPNADGDQQGGTDLDGVENDQDEDGTDVINKNNDNGVMDEDRELNKNNNNNR